MSCGPRRAVVIGRCGQVATALRESLPAAGFEVLPLARPHIDLLEPQGLAVAVRAAEPAIVINAAAYTAVDRAEDEPETAFAVNATAAGAAATAAAHAGCPILHFSTDYVFDGGSTVPYSESDATAPSSVYGASKLAGERAVAEANSWHVILRTSWICSPWGENFVRTILRLASRQETLRVVDDQYGAPTFASELAGAVGIIAGRLVAARTDPRLRGVFHVTNSGDTTWCGLARAIMAGAEKRGMRTAAIEAISTADYPTKARRPRFSKLATNKIEQVYGIRLPHWRDSLERCLDRLLSEEPERSQHGSSDEGESS